MPKIVLVENAAEAAPASILHFFELRRDVGRGGGGVWPAEASLKLKNPQKQTAEWTLNAPRMDI